MIAEVKKRTPRILVHNAQRKVSINRSELEGFAEIALRVCLQIRQKQSTDLVRLREVSIVLVSDRRMAALHRQFMGLSGPTDVITFQHGEIFVNTEEARRNARRFGISLGQELRLYIVHGLLHLHGFDDENSAAAEKMHAAQRRILRLAAGLN
jgi:probable rRNA maturation factor